MALGTRRMFDNVVFVTKGFEFEVHFQGNLHQWVPRNQGKSQLKSTEGWLVRRAERPSSTLHAELVQRWLADLHGLVLGVDLGKRQPSSARSPDRR